jgi:multiple sugar transport system ATP-binding protein
MDEPLSNLDAKLRVQTRTEIVKLHQRVATTMIYVTHDQIEAMTMGHRIVVMKDGVVQQVATPKEIYDKPANQFVAGFIGSPTMSFLPSRIEAEGDALYARGEGFSVRIPDERRGAVPNVKLDGLLLGVRPEDVLLHANGAGTISAVVDVVEPLGPEQILFLNVGSVQLTARAPADVTVASGDAIALGINANRVHLFDAESGAAYF